MACKRSAVRSRLPPPKSFRKSKSPSSRGLGHRPFTAVTRVRISLGTPNKSMACGDAGHFYFHVSRLCLETGRQTKKPPSGGQIVDCLLYQTSPSLSRLLLSIKYRARIPLCFCRVRSPSPAAKAEFKYHRLSNIAFIGRTQSAHSKPRYCRNHPRHLARHRMSAPQNSTHLPLFAAYLDRSVLCYS